MDYGNKRKLIKLTPDGKLDRELKDLAEEFEGGLLVQELVPDDAFDFLVDIISGNVTANKKGASYLI